MPLKSYTGTKLIVYDISVSLPGFLCSIIQKTDFFSLKNEPCSHQKPLINNMKENFEQDCIERAKNREPKAIAELFKRYWRAARAAAYGITADLNLAEDAASEAFYAAIDGLHDLKNKQLFGPWLRTIVIRTAKRMATSQSKDKRIGPQSRDETFQTPQEHLEQQELSVLMHEAVETLSGNLREAMSIFYFEGYSLKEAAHFLDIPEGTLKRRLHDGRQSLKDAAEKIVRGIKPMNTQREKILQQLANAADEGPQSEVFYQAIRQALRLRPFPDQMFREIMQKHWGKKHSKSPIPPERELRLRDAISNIYSPSQQAADPNHPVGAAANVIQAALPEFQPWQADWSQVNMSQITKDLTEGKENAFSFLLPPDFTETTHGSFIIAKRAWLVLDGDGSVCTLYELMQKTESMESLKTLMHQGKRLSDTLNLLWKKAESIELHEIEKLLRCLSDTIVPDVPVSFSTCDEPRYRAALRMQIGDNPIPAAIGGILNPRPSIFGDGNVASITIHLESWASIRSGQTIELAPFSMPDI